MKFHSAIDTPYSDAIQASLEQTMMLSRDNSSSGYSSDGETSASQEESSSAVEDAASCSSASSELCSEAETVDIEGEISFLQKKQSLLKRAISAMKREEAYDAHKARATAFGHREESSVWTEAREILDVLKGCEGKGDAQPTLKRPAASSLEKYIPKRQRIDVSSVTCVSSSKIGDTMMVSSSARATSRVSFVCHGSWVAKALTYFIPSITKKHESSHDSDRPWEVVNDPQLGLLMVPPSKIPAHQRVELKDALGFTSNAQLITLSTPPFCVVHANRSFLLFSGLQSMDVIGKPIESVLQVVPQVSPTTYCVPSEDGSCALESHIISSKKACRLLLIPITDSFRNPLGGMSHLLVRLKPSGRKSRAVEAAAATAVPKHLGINENHHVFGTIG